MLKFKVMPVMVLWVDNLLLKDLLILYISNDLIICVTNSFHGSKLNGKNNIIR